MKHPKAVGSAIAALAALLLVGCARPDLDGVPAGFELHPDFRLELAAAEPVVVDPIDLAFDERGRAFVLEMPGYPDMERPSRIVLLTDRDEDGRWDDRRLFADVPSLTDSILPWRRGLLVAAPPDLVYLVDEDGDGRADRREVLLSGFAEGNPQHNVNALRYGLDNWIWGVNGGNGGRPFWPDAPDQRIELGGDDFRVDFASRRFEPIGPGAGGFGMTFGPWGRIFGTHNLDHLSQVVVPRRYVSRLPAAWQDGRQRLAPGPDGGPAELFPIGRRETRPNHPEQSSRFSAACAVTAWSGGDRPSAPGFGVFVADPSANLVHRALVDVDGAVARAGRGRPGVEFLASTDPQFRPVNLRVGPDGALYVLDMYRGVIEHPEWIPDSMEAALDLYRGDGRGRIYRIVPTTGVPAETDDWGGFDRSRPDELIAALGHPNRWRRTVAQRLLVEEFGGAAPAAVVRRLREGLADLENPLRRLHAIWTLVGLDAADVGSLATALADPHPELRRNAVAAVEEVALRGGDRAEFGSLIIALVADADAGVRLQAMLTIGLFLDAAGVDLGESFERDAVAAVAATAMNSSGDGTDEIRGDGTSWLTLAASTVLAREPAPAIELLLAAYGEQGGGPWADETIERVAALISPEQLADAARSSRVQRALSDAARAGSGAGLALLGGFAAAAESGGGEALERGAVFHSLRALRRVEDSSVATAAWRLSAALGEELAEEDLARLDCAGASAADDALPTEQRLEFLELYALRRHWPDNAVPTNCGAPGGAWVERMAGFLDASQPRELQRVAMAALGSARALEAEVSGELLARWRQLGPAARRDAAAFLIWRRGQHRALLDAIESGRIGIGEMNLDLERRRYLLRSPDSEVARRARALFDDAGVVTRAEAIAAMRPALALDGDAEQGRAWFEQLCARCHRKDGSGAGPGPDLSGIGRKSAETLLHDILDPNAALDTAYGNYILETTDGEIHAGLLAQSSDSGVVLYAAEGAVIEIEPERIREVRSDGLSMMPEGLEEGLAPSDMADLLAFLTR